MTNFTVALHNTDEINFSFRVPLLIFNRSYNRRYIYIPFMLTKIIIYDSDSFEAIKSKKKHIRRYSNTNFKIVSGFSLALLSGEFAYFHLCVSINKRVEVTDIYFGLFIVAICHLSRQFRRGGTLLISERTSMCCSFFTR